MSDRATPVPRTTGAVLPPGGGAAPGAAPCARREVRLLHLGRSAYEPVLELQRSLQSALRADAGQPGTLVLVEHEPVITLGRNHPVPDLRAPASVVSAAGIRILQIERGGDITYHGPGQLVAYPIIDLRAWRLGPVDYVAALEGTAIRLLAGYGIVAGRKPGARGAWVGKRKIASVGVNVRGGVTMHGIAINVAPDFDHFALINPCGLDGVEMTGISRETGRAVAMAEVEERYVEAFGAEFACEVSSGFRAPGSGHGAHGPGQR